ncbi:hypothetical protein BKA83DRAFT_11823 [Pisolithus microcarpus]|nr:hypothetical protein BKA83DRAFT_11823 [Pisolithus microcarpus]
MSKARQQPMSTCTDMTGYIPVRNNHHTPIHTSPDDHWVTHYRASNRATYPDHAMRHSLRYSQDDESEPVFGELPLIHHPSAASRMGQVSILPYRGYASFRFDNQAKHHDGTSRIHQPFGQPSPTESEVTWSTPSHAVAPQELHPSYSSGENILTSTDLSIDRSIRAVTTTNVAILHVLHDFATGMTSGCVGDYGCMDPVSDQRIGSNLPPFSLSDTSPTPYEPRTLGHLFHTGRGNLAILPGTLVANDRADDASIHHDRTMACGWIEPDGKACGEQIDYHCEGRFATAHGINNISWNVKVKCRWCPPSAKKRGETERSHPASKGSTYEVSASKENGRIPWSRRRRRN